MKYLIIIEKANKNYSADIPDMPGCIATGKTIKETKKNIQEALNMHLEGLAEDGTPSPKAKAKADYVAVSQQSSMYLEIKKREIDLRTIP